MQLIVAEKPSQARSIANVLNEQFKSSNGCLEGQNTVITWCIGHLVGLCMPEDYDPGLKRWDLNSLPIIPDSMKLKPIPSTKKQWSIVKRLLKSRSFGQIINATDSGREGELIFENCYQLAGSRKPVLRLWTSSLTDYALRKALSNLIPAQEFSGLRDAAKSRAEADWIIGLNATRFYTICNSSRRKDSGVYTVGRVQTPTLALIVEREKEIRNFRSEKYWTLEAKFDQVGVQYHGKWFKGKVSKFKNPKDADLILKKIKGKQGQILSVEKKNKTQKPPLLYDLTTLQKEANKKLELTAEQTLSIAQNLYEKHKAISYPRTSSRYLTPDVAALLPQIVDRLGTITKYSEIVRCRPIQKVGSRYINSKKVVDHHAIIPTGKIPAALNKAESNIVEMIFRRSLAAFYEDKIEATTTVITEVENEQFKSTGKTLVKPGWWAVNPLTNKAQEKFLPELSKNKPVKTIDAIVKEDVTKPPQRFTESELLKEMELAGKKIDDEAIKEAMKDCGLGTPATRSSIIEGLKKRKLVTLSSKSLVPTEKAIELIESLGDSPLISAELTGDWERKLNLMARGEYSRQNFMDEIRELCFQVVAKKPFKATKKMYNTVPSSPIKLEKLSYRDKENRLALMQKDSRNPNSVCPSCSNKLRFHHLQSGVFAQCISCKLSFRSDEHGNSIFGNCGEEGCNGPLHQSDGKLHCLLCEKSIHSKVDKEVSICPKCDYGMLVLKNHQNHFYVKCDSCSLSYNTTEEGISMGGECSSCSGPINLTKAKKKVCTLCGLWQ